MRISVEQILPFVWRWRASLPDGGSRSGVRLSKAWAKAAARAAARKASRAGTEGRPGPGPRR